ncbi:MAG: hypothetical protein IJB65_07885 [Clostridia bacterium]|nr:hypothetical protein [Clostridia bacterium]
MTKKSVLGSVKNIFLWGVLGIAAALLISLVGSYAAMKTASPLNAVSVVALASVGLGAFAAAFGGRKTEGKITAGFAAGGFYLLILLAASLWGERGEISAYLLLAAAVAGALAGALFGAKRKVSAHKRIKKLTRT